MEACYRVCHLYHTHSYFTLGSVIFRLFTESTLYGYFRNSLYSSGTAIIACSARELDGTGFLSLSHLLIKSKPSFPWIGKEGFYY